ncbi:hypothetical protein ACFSMW_16195 [Virgibacillus halophilus]|uniref:DUF4083 domain-containing protein n=1 Tax=Tigheibacillus halophilus TaxID=361280 RepID=A0ABU5C521_9BACI|nr:hypothetical protein [Virgibacillus halophilus]
MDLISFTPLIILLIYLLIIGFIAYFLINVLLFMRRKSHSDDLLKQKIEELTRKLGEQKDK